MSLYGLVKLYEKMAAKIDFLGWLWKRIYYQDLVEREIEAAGISSRDQVLVIGCGSSPFTMEIIAKKTKALVVGIDNDPRTIKPASRYLLQRGVVSRVEHGEGINYPLEQFAVIIITLGVMHKEKIMGRVLKDMPPKTRLICRNPAWFFERKYMPERLFLDKIGFSATKISAHWRKSMLV